MKGAIWVKRGGRIRNCRRTKSGKIGVQPRQLGGTTGLYFLGGLLVTYLRKGTLRLAMVNAYIAYNARKGLPILSGNVEEFLVSV